MKTKAGEALVELQVGLGFPLDLPERKNSGPYVSEEGSEKDNNVEEEPLECVKSNNENVTNESIQEKKEANEKSVIPEREFRSAIPRDNFEN